MFGVVVGLVLGVDATTYWVLAALAGVGGVLAGFEHPDGWGGADRGLVGGAIYALGLLLAHYISGVHAKVSLGSFPPFLIIVSAIIGMLLGAVGGRHRPQHLDADAPGRGVPGDDFGARAARGYDPEPDEPAVTTSEPL